MDVETDVNTDELAIRAGGEVDVKGVPPKLQPLKCINRLSGFTPTSPLYVCPEQ